MAKSEIPRTGRTVVYAAAVFLTLVTTWQLAAVWFPLAWAVVAWRWPLAPCRKCKGTKVNTGSGKKRFGPCGRCGGSGTRWVTGSRWLHKQVRAFVKYRRKKKEQR